MDSPSRAWYVKLIAAVYLVACSGWIIYYISHCFGPGSIRSPRELLSLGATVAAWLCFFKPTWGHRGLLAVTVATLVSIGNSDPQASTFHFIVLGLLALPFFTRRNSDRQAMPQAHALW
jgi:hypothetical protein